MSDVIQSNIQLWRAKAAAGTLTRDEQREAIQAIRKERISASTTSANSRTKTATAKAKAAPIDGDALLNSFF